MASTTPNPTSPAPTPNIDDVHAAATRLAPYTRHTPVLHTHVEGHPLALKLEHLQRTGAFKLRGALNAMMAKPGTTHVVTASGGNHGLGVATAAQLLGIQAIVYVPETVPEAKSRRLEASGAQLVRVGNHYARAAEAAHDHADAADIPYLHAYDDPFVVAGQGTIGREIVHDAGDCDTIAVAVGGGGMLAGITLASRDRQISAIEPTGCQSLHAALEANEPVDTSVDSVASSALGAARLGTVPFAVVGAHPVTPALVTDAEILEARDRLWEEFRIAAEPAAAVPFAAWLAGRVPGAYPCLVVCGANADWKPTS